MNTIRLIGIALATWLAGTLVLFALAWKLSSPETTANAVLWAFNHWWAAFASGLLVLLVVALATKTKPLQAIMIYALPVVVLSALAGICLLIYPNASLREELGTYLPVALVFYVFGWLWASIRKTQDGAMARTMLPPLVGGVLILGFIAVPVFTGNDFLYRNAFKLDVGKLERNGTEAWVDCRLEIRKPGNYQFAAPAIYLLEPYMPGISDDVLLKPGVIAWGDQGSPKDGATGTFPLRIRWEGIPAPAIQGTTPPVLPFEAPVYLEARDGNDSGTLIYTISGSLAG